MAYSQQLTQTGLAGAVSWGIIGGSLPAGLMLNLSTGVVSGVPTVVGSSAFTVRATRANCSGDADYSLEIAPGSITTIVASPNPVAAGQPLTLTATVSSPGEGTPTGSVRFTINGLPVGGPISLVAGKATITTIVSGANAHLAPATMIRASYPGDGHFQPSSGSVSVTVYGFSVQDDTTADHLLFDGSGAYVFTHCAGRTRFTMTGRGRVTSLGCNVSLQHADADRRVQASAGSCFGGQTGSGQVVFQGVTYPLDDSDRTNNTNRCQL